MMAWQDGSPTDNLLTTGTSAKKLAEFRILLPDQSVFSFELSRKCTGQECLDQMCDRLGIVESDYFGLQYVDKSSGCNVWLNKRHQVRHQCQLQGKLGSPYQLKFAIRFYTDPELLLQPTTIDAFYKDLKYQIKRGDIKIPDGKKSTVGAKLAQADFGDLDVASDQSTSNSPSLVYPPYYTEAEWNDGIAYLISKEHKKLKGISKRDAQLLLIQDVYQNEFYGMVYVPSVMSDGQEVVLGVGARYVRIYNSRWTCIKKIPFHALSQIAFVLKYFTLTYHTRDEDHQPIEKKLRFILPCRTVAVSLFRTIAEEQVFFYQETVSERIRNHTENSANNKWKKFCHKVFKKKYRPRYYYDIQRTKKEAYRYSWQLLHQVQSNALALSPPTADVPIPEPISLSYINVTLVSDSDEEDGGTDPSTKSEVCWGLSRSSCNLAKELLTAQQLSVAESEENFLQLTKLESKSSQEKDDKDEDKPADEESVIQEEKPEPLSGAQGKKLRRLLLKIQDERLCTVCMDELIACVFCPCGHYVACNKCARRLDRCPVCRQAVGYVQHVYTRF